MKRIKGIDTIRGLSIFFMCFHIVQWWIRPEDYEEVFYLVVGIVGEIAASGLLFISGVSAVMLYRNRLAKAKISDAYSIEQVKNEYLFRALIILIIAFIFNSIIAIGTLNPLDIWKWFIPLTIGLSLLLAFPLLKTSKSFRILLALILWIIHYYLLAVLSPHQGQLNIFGILYYIFYNSIDVHPLIYYFSFFLIGTVIADIILDIFLKDNQEERRLDLKNKFVFPSLIIGPILVLIGVLFRFPDFLIHITFSSTVYTLGVFLTIMSVSLIIQEFEVIKLQKNYRFFYFYSYYSLTVFFSHYLLYFIFLEQLNAVNIWIAVVVTFILLTLLIRVIYKKFGPKASLKVQIGRISGILARRVEAKKRNRSI
ncbi:MAG: hypothetical protein ACFFBV_14115 [Promethearchaeota archaeon]